MAAGAEEQHTADATAVGPWAAATNVAITTLSKHTGSASFECGHTATGSSQMQVDQAKGWWSFAFSFNVWGDGTWRWLFTLSGGRFFSIVLGQDVDNSHVALYSSDPIPTLLAEGTRECAKTLWNCVKLEFDNGIWTCWLKPVGGEWAEEFTFDESDEGGGDFTELDFLQMSLNTASDEEKGETYSLPYLDDCLCWDSQGDNWNSRITAMADFPRISAAHMPTANGEWDDLNEIPPDHASKPDADDENAYYDCEDLDDGTKGYEDYTAETIQAVMIARVDGSVGVSQAEWHKFNIYDGDTLHADSEEDGRWVQAGANASSPYWWTLAGYYPRTPDGENWTEGLFNTCEYGCHVLTAYTDQVTVQVIFFGSSHEWEPPGESAGYAHSQVVMI